MLRAGGRAHHCRRVSNETVSQLKLHDSVLDSAVDLSARWHCFIFARFVRDLARGSHSRSHLAMRLAVALIAAAAGLTAAVVGAEQPQISETSLLLPYFSGSRPVQTVLSTSSGCWHWSSPNGRGIITVEPTPTAECSDGTSSSAIITVASKSFERSAAVVLAKSAGEFVVFSCRWECVLIQHVS